MLYLSRLIFGAHFEIGGQKFCCIFPWVNQIKTNFDFQIQSLDAGMLFFCILGVLRPISSDPPEWFSIYVLFRITRNKVSNSSIPLLTSLCSLYFCYDKQRYIYTDRITTHWYKYSIYLYSRILQLYLGTRSLCLS